MGDEKEHLTKFLVPSKKIASAKTELRLMTLMNKGDGQV
jgi:hypothetical protein